MRFVVIHNHIFKNAGSTVDRVFERAGFRHTCLEGTAERPVVSPRRIVETVEADPGIEYISSHVLRVPRPADLEDIAFLDVTFLRHPIDRLYSIYSYTRQDGVNDFPGIEKSIAFAPFVDALARIAPAHLHSPQSVCLGNERNFYFPPDRSHLDRALDTVAQTRFLGAVDLIEPSFRTFAACCRALFPGKDFAAFTGPPPEVNRSARRGGSLEERLERIRAETGDERYAFLERANEADVALYRAARAEVLRRHALIGPGVPAG